MVAYLLCSLNSISTIEFQQRYAASSTHTPESIIAHAIEHFDEQLDNYLEKGVVGHVLPQYVGPFEEQKGVPVHLFRAYYVDTGIFELLGKRYEIKPLAREVAEIYEQLRQMESNGGRLVRRDA